MVVAVVVVDVAGLQQANARFVVQWLGPSVVVAMVVVVVDVVVVVVVVVVAIYLHRTPHVWSQSQVPSQCLKTGYNVRKQTLLGRIKLTKFPEERVTRCQGLFLYLLDG